MVNHTPVIFRGGEQAGTASYRWVTERISITASAGIVALAWEDASNVDVSSADWTPEGCTIWPRR
jgi:hypothetical protein